MNRIPGNPVGVPNPKTDWNQTDETKADFLKNKPIYLTNFFKPIPEGKTPDDLKEVGVYLGYDTANYNGFPYEMPYLLFVSNHGNTLGDIDAPMVCQIKVGCSETGAIIPESVVKWRYCGQDNEWWEWTTVPEKGINITPSGVIVDQEYNPESENAQSGIAVAQAIAGIGGGSGGETFFENSTPQIDITLEEEVKTLAISEWGGKALTDYNFTTMKIVMENAKLAATGTNTEIVIRVNNNILSGCSINAPTTFINNSAKQYWGGYISLPENLYLGGSSASGSDLWRIPIQMPVNTSRAMGYKQIETIYIDSVSATMPIGTKIKIWLK